MNSQAIECYAYEGLCNRINVLASAMAASQTTQLHWAINQHCPVEFEELFGNLEGVHVCNENEDGYEYGVTEQRICWFYPKNVRKHSVARFRELLYDAYRKILSSIRMTGHCIPDAPALGITFRRHQCDGSEYSIFWEGIERVVAASKPRTVHVAFDDDTLKQAAVRSLSEMGVSVSVNDCTLLQHDFDRSRENVLGMCQDLLSLAKCTIGIVSGSTRSTVPDSARGYGVEGYFVYDDGIHRHDGRDDLFEMRHADELISMETKNC